MYYLNSYGSYHLGKYALLPASKPSALDAVIVSQLGIIGVECTLHALRRPLVPPMRALFISRGKHLVRLTIFKALVRLTNSSTANRSYVPVASLESFFFFPFPSLLVALAGFSP
ncbi:hypothetical protein B0H12DRAFT_1134565 [Mycena haematopus]|nr:hypothetical protein B0H12DRAFT_1134539 [Mycena haematopus]KAJ7240664.1 hypothetical protein B0H12DRAFT_1134565 [Mycena haematopus]